MHPSLVEPPGRLFRVGRVSEPLNFSVISAADAMLTDVGNRFDVPGEGVCYLGSSAEGCYAETLARFRVSARVCEAVRQKENGFMVCGGVPADWRTQRLLVTCTMEDPLPFLDVEAAQTHTYLTAELSETLARIGVGALDVAHVRGPNRVLSRAIAAWAFEATDENGEPRYGGLRYLSRLGDHECWAVFEGTELRETTRTPVLTSDPDLCSIADDFGLRVF